MTPGGAREFGGAIPNGHPSNLTAGFSIPPELLEAIAALVAARVVDELGRGSEPWLSVEAAAAYIAAPKSRIHDLKAAGRLRYAKDGRRLLFRREWLDEVLEEGERRA